MEDSETATEPEMTATIVPAMRYDELDLHPDLARAIQEAGYVDCMPV